MSHNYPYRRQPLDSSLKPDPGSYSSSGRSHTSPDHDFSWAPQESYSSSHQSSSSSSSSRAVPRWTQDSAFSVLSSCGLEPSDLALLAEMPEDALTVESLPQVLKQIKGKRGTVKPHLQGSPSPSSTSSSSCAPNSTGRPAARLSSNDRDHPHSHMVQYPTKHIKPSPLPAELDRWGNPIALSCVRAQPSSSSSSSSRYAVDFHHRGGPSEYGKTCRDPSPVSSQNYLHQSGTSEFVTPGRSSHLVPSQDFSYRPGASKFSETSRNATHDSTKDYNHIPGLEYGKTGRDVGPASFQNQPSFSPASRDQTTRPSQPGPVGYTLPPAQESYLRPSFGLSGSETSTRSSSQSTASMPSRQNALDFHGATPPIYPHSCSLCAITVMSEKVWLKHINGPHHADGQLNLLQKFPSWDCRMETVDRVNNEPEQQREEENPVSKPQTTNQNSNPPQPNTKTQKSSVKSKVVCVKFPAHAVDEAYLRKLAEPFGKVVKILMFPSLAFVELGSMDQAKDLVKFHTNYPPTVNGELMEFRISSTFNFLQSSSVVSFFPTPSGDGQTDLISIIKRFGTPLYTLFLPSRAFVEMKDAAEAQKIVDYYASNNLRINDDLIKVSFSGEYKSLMRVPSAKRYEEETTKTTRSSSRDREERRTESRRRRSRTRSRSRSKEKKYRTRSKSKEKSEKDTRTKSRDRSSRDGRTRTRSRSKESSRRNRSRSREKASRARSRSGDRSSRYRKTRTRSKSKEKSSNERKSEPGEKSAEHHRKEERSRSKSRSKEKIVVPEKTETPAVSTGSSSDPHPVRDTPGAAEKEHIKEETESSDDDSDIEGMEVIGEDGESVQDEDMETEEEEKEECPAERTNSPEEGKKDEEASHHEQEEDEERRTQLKEEERKEICVKEEEETKSVGEEETTLLKNEESEWDFPIDLDSCITLDELNCDDAEEKVSHQRKSPSSRVLFFSNVPLDVFTDAEFIQLVSGYGTAVLFLRVPGREAGFIEMSSSAEAQKVKDALTARPLWMHGCRILADISRKYTRLFNGHSVESIEGLKEGGRESRSQSNRRSERLSQSKTSDRDESSRRSEGRKSTSRRSEEKESKTSHRKSSEKESASKKSPGKKSPVKRSERLSRTTPGKELTNEKTPEKESTNEKTPEKESTNEIITEKESTNEKTTPEKESTNEKTTPEKESTNEFITEKESTNKVITEKMSTNEKTTLEKESTNEETTQESELTNEMTPETESTNETTPGMELTTEKLPGMELTNEKPPETESANETIPGMELTNEKLPETEFTNEKPPETESTNETTPGMELTTEKLPGMELTSKKPPETESTTEMAPETELTNEKPPETESTNETTPGMELTTEKLPGMELTSKKPPETESTTEMAPETELTNEKPPERDSASRLMAEESQGEKSLEKGSKKSSRTDSGTETSPETESSKNRTFKRRGSHKDDPVPEKKDKKESEDEETRTNDAEASGEEKMEIQEKGEDLQSPGLQQDFTGDSPRPQTAQKPADPQDFQVKEEQQPEPISVSEELQKPLKPVGTEFVRPVVGYFCNLCQVIYADEDEAKQQHCSSEEHYRKYQEKTGKDPWAS
ncbi:uncharacterized protein LOC141793123 isoform X2 [Halichoeres trimaculatus]|uniref:uncharacterized protein LOC141793123 isoform X2 n=1 Tax=Halichoeres trimaculatus TaxID=147232 RepID=UPI003D9E0773